MTKASFTYTAIVPATGQEQRGTMEAENQVQAVNLLKDRGLAPVSVERAVPARAATPMASEAARWGPAGALALRRRKRLFVRRIRRKQVVHFTRQLATLVNAGVPLARGLEVLRRQERHASMRSMVENLSSVIDRGGNLSDGLRQHPRVFDALFVSMTMAGEAGGLLGTVLERQAHFLEKSERLKGRVQAAMTYPVVIMAVAAVILMVLMVMVVPKFELIFAGLLKGQPLPTLTLWLLGVSRFLRTHFVLALCLSGSGIFGYRLVRQTSAGVRAVDWLLLRLPVVGDLMVKAVVARFARTLGSLLASGVPILEAMAIAGATSGNFHIAAVLDQVRERVKQGDSIAQPLEAAGVFPGLVTGMIQVGEETGALSEMLRRIADTYDEEVDQAVAGLTSLLEPVMIVAMAAVVGAIVIALFLPIVGIIQHLQ